MKAICPNCGCAGACHERCPEPTPAGMLRREARRAETRARECPEVAAHMGKRAALFERCAEAAERMGER